MENKEKKFNLAKELHQSGKISEAQKIYLDLLKEEENDKLYFLLIESIILKPILCLLFSLSGVGLPRPTSKSISNLG